MQKKKIFMAIPGGHVKETEVKVMVTLMPWNPSNRRPGGNREMAVFREAWCKTMKYIGSH